MMQKIKFSPKPFPSPMPQNAQLGITHDGQLRWAMQYDINIDMMRIRYDAIVGDNQITAHFWANKPKDNGNSHNRRAMRAMRKFLKKGPQ